MRTLKLKEPGDPALRLMLTHDREIGVDKDCTDNVLVHVLATAAAAISGPEAAPEGFVRFANLVEEGGWPLVAETVDGMLAEARGGPYTAVLDLVGMDYQARVTVILPKGTAADVWMALVEAIGRMAEAHKMPPAALLRAIALDPPRGQVAIVGEGIPESAPTGARAGISIPVPTVCFPTKGGDA